MLIGHFVSTISEKVDASIFWVVEEERVSQRISCMPKNLFLSCRLLDEIKWRRVIRKVYQYAKNKVT
jgi:hypothetical protein